MYSDGRRQTVANRPIAVIDRQLKQGRLNMSAGKTLALGLVVSAGSYPSWVSTFALMSMC